VALYHSHRVNPYDVQTFSAKPTKKGRGLPRPDRERAWERDVPCGRVPLFNLRIRTDALCKVRPGGRIHRVVEDITGYQNHPQEHLFTWEGDSLPSGYTKKKSCDLLSRGGRDQRWQALVEPARGGEGKKKKYPDCPPAAPAGE